LGKPFWAFLIYAADGTDEGTDDGADDGTDDGTDDTDEHCLLPRDHPSAACSVTNVNCGFQVMPGLALGYIGTSNTRPLQAVTPGRD